MTLTSPPFPTGASPWVFLCLRSYGFHVLTPALGGLVSPAVTGTLFMDSPRAEPRNPGVRAPSPHAPHPLPPRQKGQVPGSLSASLGAAGPVPS